MSPVEPNPWQTLYPGRSQWRRSLLLWLLPDLERRLAERFNSFHNGNEWNEKIAYEEMDSATRLITTLRDDAL